MLRNLNLSSILLLVLALCSINPSINAQSYVPQVAPITSCSAGEELVSLGSNDVTRLTTNTATTVANGNYIYTHYINTTRTVTIKQLSLGINDNLNILTVVQLRLGIVLISGTSMVRVGQSEEILLYSTTKDIIYADLESPVQLLPGVQYAIVFWASGTIFTGVDASPPSGTPVNSAYLAYTANGLPYQQTMSYIYGRRALQATGCVSTTDPYSSADTTLYSFCAYAQKTDPPSPMTSYSYSRSTTTYAISGVLAVSNSQSGTSNGATWNRVIGGYANYALTNSGPWYYPSTGPASNRLIVVGMGSITTPNQRFYTSGSRRVDDGGISFVAGDGTQYIISFTNNSIAITELSRGSMGVVTSADSTGFNAQVTTSINQVPACSAPSTYTPDTFSCAANEVAVSFGDDSLPDALAQYSTPNNYYSYSNFIYFREFTAPDNAVTLKQLTFRIFDNPGKLVKIRMGIYTAPSSAASLPRFTILQETREVLMVNPMAGVIAINLKNNIDMVPGKNYTIAMIADHWLYTSYGYYLPTPYFYTLPYEVLAPSAMPPNVQVQYTAMVLPMGANGCAKQQTQRTVQFCANFVYADRINQYYGTLNLLANPLQSDLGQYYYIASGSGISNRTMSSGARTLGNFTVKSYYLPSNNRLYLPGQNGGAPVDTNGLQIVVSMPNAGYAVQMRSWIDPASAAVEYREAQQTYSTNIPTNLGYLLTADFVYRDHQEGSPIVCNAPSRPLNLVSPLSVARASCPNNANAIADTFGDTKVGNFANHHDGNLIDPNKIYTYRFVAESTGTVSQLAIGILNNMDRGLTLVRLGLYAAANNSLMVQTNQLTLNQAVDQLIVMNLPYPVGIVGGQTYYIALFASAPLEVATTSASDSPSMTFAFSASGLPATFSSGGNAVSPSVGCYVCVSTTHSFCAHFQYAPSSGASTTIMYQGLLALAGSPQTNAYGTYQSVTAMAGRVMQYVRTQSTPTNALTLLTFSLRSGTTVNLYTTSTNNQPLDSTGAILDFSNSAVSNLQFNTSINKMDESLRQGIDQETTLIYSGMSVQPLREGSGIPSCGLANVPRSTPQEVALPTCPAGQELISYGDADQADVVNNQEGVYYAPAQQIYLRQFTSHPTRATMIHQLKFGININYNTVNRIRLGLYDANYTFMAGSQDIAMYNPNNQMFTGVLSTPQYLAPNSVYNLAWWTEAAVYSGFTSVSGPAGVYPFNNPWPTVFENTAPNSQRAIAGFGCTTSTRPPSTNTQSSSSSSSDLSKGAIAGVVIGVMIGSNLLLLACLYLCCLNSAAAGKASNWKHTELEESRTAADASNVELGEVSTS